MKITHPQLDHFVKLARRGVYPAASGGEKRANALAGVAFENIPGLDQDAVVGFVMLLECILLGLSSLADLEGDHE